MKKHVVASSKVSAAFVKRLSTWMTQRMLELYVTWLDLDEKSMGTCI